jgi:hypothetical protein
MRRYAAKIDASQPRKYRNTPTVVDGIRFDSKREARRYQELKLLEKAGEIHALELQPVFPLHAWVAHDEPPEKVGFYRGDFRYCTCGLAPMGCDRSARIVEDSKGIDTPLSKWKRRHVKAQYGIDVQLV